MNCKENNMDVDEDMTAVGIRENRENRENERDRGGRTLKFSDADLAVGYSSGGGYLGGGNSNRGNVVSIHYFDLKDVIIQKALENMNLSDELVVKEDHGEQRDQYGCIMCGGGGSDNASGGGGGNGGVGLSGPGSNVGDNSGVGNALDDHNYSTGAYNIDKSHTILVKNLPLNWRSQELRNHFRQFGAIKFATKRSNDEGLVRFYNQSDAKLATISNGSRMNGRKIEVNLF